MPRGVRCDVGAVDHSFQISLCREIERSSAKRRRETFAPRTRRHFHIFQEDRVVFNAIVEHAKLAVDGQFESVQRRVVGDVQ